MEKSKVFVIITTVLTLIAAGFVAYLYVTADREWGFDIEWNVTKSSMMWGILSFIGFFLQFINWTDLSFKEGWVDNEGNFWQSNDMTSEMMGSCLFPLIGHFLLIPALYGAALYYAIMGIVALFNFIIPYLAALLCIGFAVLFYFVAERLMCLRFKYLFGILWFAAGLGIMYGASIFPRQIKLPEVYSYVEVDADDAVAYRRPDVDAPLVLVRDEEGDSLKPLQFDKGTVLGVHRDYQGEWYCVVYNDTGLAYMPQKFFKDLPTGDSIAVSVPNPE